jgi:hypothetical protein
MRSHPPNTEASIFINKIPPFSRLLRIKSLVQRKYVVSGLKNRENFVFKLWYYHLIRMVYEKLQNSLKLEI